MYVCMYIFDFMSMGQMNVQSWSWSSCLQLRLWREHGLGHLPSLDLSSSRFGDLGHDPDLISQYQHRGRG